MMRMLRAGATIALLLPALAAAQADPVSRSWNQPVAPARLIGNIYYVGASGVTAFLITSDSGHILIDGGFAETAPQILANIRRLGFTPRDVRVLLNSHAHYDHAGGLAMLKDSTRARLFISRGDVELVEAGGRRDFRFGNSLTFPRVKVDSVLPDRHTFRFGNTVLTAHSTPGHTRGCTSYSMAVPEAGQTLHAIFFCSLSLLDYRLVHKPSYAGIKEDFEKSFARLRSLRCDVFFAPHAHMFALNQKRARTAR